MLREVPREQRRDVEVGTPAPRARVDIHARAAHGALDAIEPRTAKLEVPPDPTKFCPRFETVENNVRAKPPGVERDARSRRERIDRARVDEVDRAHVARRAQAGARIGAGVACPR